MKKTTVSLLALSLLVALAACASVQLPWTNTAAQANPNNFNADPAKMPLEQKLAFGTLKLEGTPLAVSAQEARELLPLWKAVQTLSTNAATSQAEMDALFKQIQDTMTPEQVQKVQKMTWTSEDMAATMRDLGIEMPPAGGRNAANVSESERATRVAQFRAQGGNEGAGAGRTGPGSAGGGNRAGRFQGGFPGGPEGAFTGAAPGQAQIQRTPGANLNPARRSLGFNQFFIGPLIKVLQERAGG